MLFWPDTPHPFKSSVIYHVFSSNPLCPSARPIASVASSSLFPIASYEHSQEQRVNNPPVGLVTPDTDPDLGESRTYAFDPHLDPQLVWAGKAEHASFEVPTVSLHVHERIDPRTIIEAVRRRNGESSPQQLSFFEVARQEPLHQAIEFYQHAQGWTNRLVAGDSLLVMNSLLEKEGLAGKVLPLRNTLGHAVRNQYPVTGELSAWIATLRRGEPGVRASLWGVPLIFTTIVY